MIRLKQATTDNLNQLVPLFNQYRIFYNQKPDIEGATRFISERLQIKDSHIIIAFNNKNTPIGFTQLYPSFSSVSMQRTYILNDLFVAKTYRNKGVATALLQAAKQYAKANNAKGLTLETATDNPAQHLYKKLNWKKDQEVFHFTWLSNEKNHSF